MKLSNKKVSIIVVNYNGIKFLQPCIESLRKIKYPNFEIVIVDNHSTDGSVKFIMQQTDITISLLSQNEGLAKAQNVGARLAKGEYLFFLNNDVLVDAEILNKLVPHYFSKIAVLGCRMGNYDGTRELDSFISVDRFGYPCGTTSNMFYPDGAIFISKKIFNEIGGFDEKLFLYGEDRDLCWRIHLAGYLVLPCVWAVFYHASSCVSDTNYRRRYMAERNIIRSMLKNYSGGYLWCIIPQYIVLSVGELLFLLLTGRFLAIFKSYLPAYWWNIANLPDTLRERKKVQTLRKVPDSHIRKIMSKQIGKIFVLRKFGIPKFIEREK